MKRNVAIASEEEAVRKNGHAESRYPPSNDNEALQEGRCRTLAINELLFGMGEAKRELYLVKSGTVAVYEPRSSGHRKPIEFGFPGDIVGLGFLEVHACSARATVKTEVELLPLSAQDHLFADDLKAQGRLAEAIERDVEFLRESCVRFSQQNPLGRLAAFLLTLSRENENEGRDPALLFQPLNCRVVADFLAFSIDRLASLLVELERRGLIAPCLPDGLRLSDIAGLEGLAGLGRGHSIDDGKDLRTTSFDQPLVISILGLI
jgi:CRP/FNR family transcriptional regulator, anaerobic regulatory protein